MDSVFGYVFMAGITFPVSYLLARSCLRGVIRLVTGENHRNVLSSQP